MVANLFSFGGRLTRLSFLGLTVLLVVLAALEVCAIVFLAALLFSGKGIAATFLGGFLAIVLGLIPLIWANLALATKRLRDAGFPPALVISAMIVFGLLDHFLLAPALGGPAHRAILHNSLIGVSVQIIYLGILFLWPSAAIKDDRGEPACTVRLPPTPSPEPAYAAPLAVAQMPSGPRLEFGLRRH